MKIVTTGIIAALTMICVGTSSLQKATADVTQTTDQTHVHFLATADPQFDNGAPSDLRTKTLSTMAQVVQSQNLKGLIVAGDLTQNTRPYDEYDWYTHAFPPVANLNIYDGIGNHDLASATKWQAFACKLPSQLGLDTTCVDQDMIKNALIDSHRSLSSSSMGIHYSWKWNNITFVHLNLFPGNTPDLNNLSPEGSLDFLKSVVNAMDKQNDRLVIIHHYGFDNFSIKWWSQEQRNAYWETISPVKVIAIFTGHVHLKAKDNPEADFYRPPTQSAGPPKIPAFTAGAALNGVYLDVDIDTINKTMKVTQFSANGQGLPTYGPILVNYK